MGIMGSGKVMRAECRLAEKGMSVSRHEAEGNECERFGQGNSQSQQQRQ